ncbi:MAG TPA: tetratricopeptide repeat protein [Urbifossiella sp.]|nr:tetratricopeptide repeat protein [Urbifossiella sp.]
MAIAGQPEPSSSLHEALELLAQGNADEADAVVTKAAKAAKKQFGSGSHPLACAYADMARLHYQAGEYKRAATEFRHAADSPMPSEPAERGDRLAFMFGFAACLEALDRMGEAEKVYRQCVDFAKALYGPASPAAASALEPLAAMLLGAGQGTEAARLLDEACGIFTKNADPAIVAALVVRAEAYKAAGRADDPFAEFTRLSEPLAIEAVSHAIAHVARKDGIRRRQILADLLRAVERRFGDGRTALADVLAAIVHHEASLGEQGDGRLRVNASRRAIWSFTKPRMPPGVLDSIDVGFEADGTIHLVPRLAREPNENEAVALEMVLTMAVDDLYARCQQNGQA